MDRHGLADRITVRQEDILALSFPDGSFDAVLCWGVLMHIPDAESAIHELVRVLKPGGMIVLSEGNMHSIEAVLMRAARRLLGKESGEVRRTPAGIEYWANLRSGRLVTRHANVNWLVRRLRGAGCAIRHHAGQFTESYTRVRFAPLESLLHGFNALWFRHVRWPAPAGSNLLIAQKIS